MGFSRQEYWSGFSFSRGFSRPRDWTQVSCIAGRFFTVWAAREAQDIRMVLRNEMNALALAPALMVFCFLLCDCRGGAAHAWSLPATVSKENQRQKLSITKSACGRNGKRFCSTLTLYAAQANHTGFYSCKYLSTSASKKKGESTIYIFINGKSFISHILFSVAVQRVINPPGPWKGHFSHEYEWNGPGKRFYLIVETCGVHFNMFLECQFQPEFSWTSWSTACSLMGVTLVCFVHHCICVSKNTVWYIMVWMARF